MVVWVAVAIMQLIFAHRVRPRVFSALSQTGVMVLDIAVARWGRLPPAHCVAIIGLKQARRVVPHGGATR
jgi:hypothetical protein